MCVHLQILMPIRIHARSYFMYCIRSTGRCVSSERILSACAIEMAEGHLMVAALAEFGVGLAIAAEHRLVAAACRCHHTADPAQLQAAGHRCVRPCRGASAAQRPPPCSRGAPRAGRSWVTWTMVSGGVTRAVSVPCRRVVAHHGCAVDSWQRAARVHHAAAHTRPHPPDR